MSIYFVGDANGSYSVISRIIATTQPLIAEIWYNSKKACQIEMPLRVVPVEQMYDRVNGVNGSFSISPGYSRPADNGKNVIFLHGFSVTPEEARGWHSEMFKRLWQSGSNARFHGVTWRGNIGTFSGGLNYHGNVVSAFTTAPHLRNYINQLAGEKIIMAHSLGNMVVSSAIADHNMSVDKFFMFNAAIPAEAFDAAQWDDSPDTSNRLVHNDWRDYTNACWSAKWHEFFINDPSDDRGRLTWKGRFSGVLSDTKLYNYYSSGDEVLEIFGGTPGISEGVVLWDKSTRGRYAWHKQETHKGGGALDLAGTSWAGWGFENPTYSKLQYDPLSNSWRPISVPYYPDAAAVNAVSLNQLRDIPVFKHHPEFMFTDNISVVSQYELLAKGIPALSLVTGVCEISLPLNSGQRNIDMNEQTSAFRPNNWGRNHTEFGVRWLHGDLKSMAFFYNFKCFESIVSQGELK